MQLDWQALSPTRGLLVEEIVAASEVPDVCICIAPGSLFLAADQAAVIYWSFDGDAWSLLGALSHTVPSAVFRTGWGTNVPPGVGVRLAVSLEPMATAANLGLSAGGEALEDRKVFAAAIARDLWAFLTSFDQTPARGPGVQSNGDMMLVPTSVLDRWLVRFNEKFARDPNFMLKAKD